MKRMWSHMRRLWPRWTLLPGLPFVAYGLFWIIRGGARWDHLVLMLVVPLLAYATHKTKRFFVGMVPFICTGVMYDSTRFLKNWGLNETTVHVCDLWEMERKLFGIPTAFGRVAVADYFHDHHRLWADLLCAIPYGTFFFIVLAYGVYLYFRDFTGMRRFGWAFLLMSAAGFLTYHIYPAAPPWYLRLHGCTVDLQAHSSAGAALMRVDSWTGFPFFDGLYGRASEVFGAMPSLHVAFPLLTGLAAWKNHGWPVRLLFALFYLSMCFSALYLDHHWVLDIVAGSLYAVVARLIVWPLIRPPSPHRLPSASAVG
jgi:inositol phosphorylceramide synthase catalytic subunit